MHFFKDNELLCRFMAINICSGISIGMINFIIPLYALSLDATSTEIGLIRGMMGVGDLLIVLPAGFLVDHFGSRRMYSVSTCIGLVTILLLTLAKSPGMLLWMIVFYGIARTLRTTSLNASFFKNITVIGIKKGGWFKGAVIIGVSFLGPLISGVALLYMGYSDFFLFSCLFLLAPLAGLWLFARINGRDPVPVPSYAPGIIETAGYYRRLVQNRLLVSATLTECMNSAFFITFTAFITIFIVKDLGLSAGVAAILISLRGGASILSLLFGWRFLYRDHTGLCLISFLMTIVGLIMIGISSDITIIAVASVILGTFSGLMTLVTFTDVGNIEGEKGKISSIFIIGSSAGGIIGPVLGGMIGDTFGIQAIFLAFIVPFLLIALFYLLPGKNREGSGEFC